MVLFSTVFLLMVEVVSKSGKIQNPNCISVTRDLICKVCITFTDSLFSTSNAALRRPLRSVVVLFSFYSDAITNAHQFATSNCLPSPAFAGLHLNQGDWRGPEHLATWTRLMSLSRHTDLCCNTHSRHHKLSHQFSPIGCGMSWLTQFVEKCTCLCLPSL